MVRPIAIMAVLAAGALGQAYAFGASPSYGPSMPTPSFASPSPTPGQSIVTPRGPAFITGRLGSMQTTTVPGGGGQGFLLDNGNGTSTLILPGGGSQVVPSPR